MLNKNIKKKINLNVLFSIVLLFFIIAYWVFILFTRSKYITRYFINDPNDTFMDYFNMLANAQYDDVYIEHSNYPAMCHLYYKALFWSIRPELNGIHATEDILKAFEPAMLWFLISLIICLLCTWQLINYSYKETGISKLLFSIGIIFSGPFFYTYERGNIILISFIFLFFFCCLYKSDNKVYRYISYFSLAISASLKIYPALFGLLLFFEKKIRWKEVTFLVIIGILMFILPFFAFDGVDSINGFINGFMYANNEMGNFGMGYNFSFSNFLKIVLAIFGYKVESVSFIYTIAILLVCLVLLIMSKEEWQRLFIIALMCIWTPTFSYTYTLIFFLPSLISYLNNHANYQNITSIIYRALFVIIFIPIALPFMKNLDFENIKFPLSGPTLLLNFTIFLMFIIMAIEIIKGRSNKIINK